MWERCVGLWKTVCVDVLKPDLNNYRIFPENKIMKQILMNNP